MSSTARRSAPCQSSPMVWSTSAISTERFGPCRSQTAPTAGRSRPRTRDSRRQRQLALLAKPGSSWSATTAASCGPSTRPPATSAGRTRLKGKSRADRRSSRRAKAPACSSARRTRRSHAWRLPMGRFSGSTRSPTRSGARQPSPERRRVTGCCSPAATANCMCSTPRPALRRPPCRSRARLARRRRCSATACSSARKGACSSGSTW